LAKDGNAYRRLVALWILAKLLDPQGNHSI
jgi:hypothetical protein